MSIRRSLLLAFLLLVALGLVACGPPEYDDFPEPPPGFELTGEALQQQEQPVEDTGPSASVDVLSGAPTIQRAGQSDTVPAADGDLLGVGDSVDTGANGLVLLTFAPGTHTYAYPGTILTVTTLDTAPNGRLILVLEMTQGLTFNSTNGRTTDSSDLITPYATVSVQQAASGSSHSFNRFNRTNRPALSTVFLTTQNWVGLQRAPTPSTPVVSVNVTQGGVTFNTGDPGAETRFSVPAGQSVEQDEEGQIQVNAGLTLNCDSGTCYPAEIDTWIADGTLEGDEGETGSFLPDDEICDPSFDGCESILLEDSECDPDFEDCGDFGDECDPDAGDCEAAEPSCDPAYEDCSEDTGDEDCDPSTEDCGDEFLDDEGSGDEESDDGYDDGSDDGSDDESESDD